jgi:hypothetical protein
VHQFENANPGFLTKLRRLIATDGLQPGISYLISESPIIRPDGTGCDVPCVCSADKKVELPETFLSFMWGITYALVVIFSEASLKPELACRGLRVERNPRLLDGATRLLTYATSLVRAYSIWDINTLPNPEFYDETSDPYIERANGAFVSAVVFILCHEIGHVDRGHCTLDNLRVYVSRLDAIMQEEEVDAYAIDTVVRSPSGGRLQPPEATGIISGLASLLMLSRTVRQDRHPYTDQRLIDGVRRLRLPDEDSLWGLGVASIKLWDSHYGCGLAWPQQADSYKQLFDEMAAKLINRPGR